MPLRLGQVHRHHAAAQGRAEAEEAEKDVVPGEAIEEGRGEEVNRR
jgi:hypothetical protein